MTEQKHLEYHLQLKRLALDQVQDAIYLIDAKQHFVYVNEAACRALGYSREEFLGITPCDIDTGYTRQSFRAVQQRMLTESRFIVERLHRRRNGNVFPVEVQMSAFECQGQIFAMALARDISERKLAEESIASRERELRTLAMSLPDNIVRYDRNGSVIYVKCKEMEEAVAVNTVGTCAHQLKRDVRSEAYIQAVESVLSSGQDCEIEMELSGQNKGLREAHQVCFVAERGENDEVVGVLAIGRDITGIKQTERELEESRSQLRGLIAHREEVLEMERKRIAREVHDELGQILTGLQMNVSRLIRKYANDSPALRKHAQETMVLTEKALGVARNVASALRPAVLDMGIAVALEWLAGRFGANTGIRCHVHIVDSGIQVDENQAIALYRITQESLTNVARHAKANRVDISLSKSATDYVLKIRDNGEGFDSEVRKAGSFGLVGIRERAFILGGTVDINSGPDRGTEITVHIPTHGIRENL